jgi:hypothetical protein
MVGELRGERLVRAVGLGDHHQPGGVLVETVHDARPLHPADARETVAAMGNQRIDQRAAGMPRGRMHDEPRRLVDHDQLVVLEHDLERDVLARGLRLLGLRHVHHDRVARVDPLARIADRAAADRDLAVEDQRLETGARQLGMSGEHAVQPSARLLARDGDFLLRAGIFAKR